MKKKRKVKKLNDRKKIVAPVKLKTGAEIGWGLMLEERSQKSG